MDAPSGGNLLYARWDGTLHITFYLKSCGQASLPPPRLLSLPLVEDSCAQTKAAVAAATAKLEALRAAQAKQEEEWAAEDVAAAEEQERTVRHG